MIVACDNVGGCDVVAASDGLADLAFALHRNAGPEVRVRLFVSSDAGSALDGLRIDGASSPIARVPWQATGGDDRESMLDDAQVITRVIDATRDVGTVSILTEAVCGGLPSSAWPGLWRTDAVSTPDARSSIRALPSHPCVRPNRGNSMNRTTFQVAIRATALGTVAAAAVMLAACTPAEAPTDIPAPATGAAASSQPPSSPVTTTQPSSTAASMPADTSDHAEVNATIDRLLGPHEAFEKVIETFRQAVGSKDAGAVAALVQYPLKATIDGRQATIADADDFVQRYDAIVTPAMAETIAAQKYADLFVNQQGVMFGDGQAWINGICQDATCKDLQIRVVTLQPAL